MNGQPPEPRGKDWARSRLEADTILKMYMMLEFMTSQLDTVEYIMDSIYKQAGEQK